MTLRPAIWTAFLFGATLLAAAAGAQPALDVDWQARADLARREADLLDKRLKLAQKQLEQEELGRLVYQTQIEVAALRELEVHAPVVYGPLTPETVERLMVESIEKQYPGREFDLYQWAYQVFGALPDDLDLRALLRDLMQEQAGGIYDPASKELYISEDFPVARPMGRMILAHEICHALQDQNYDLESLGIYADENSDLAMALMAIVEGDATLLMSEHLAQHGNPLALLADVPAMMMVDQQQLQNAPKLLSESLLFPYISGMQFFQSLAGRTRQGDHPDWIISPRWRSEIFRDPPTTSEQIIHPEKYLDGEGAMDLPWPDPLDRDAEIVSRDVTGELGIQLLLSPILGRDQARDAAAGWGADRVVLTDSGEDQPRTLVIETLWDTPADADQFEEGAREALMKLNAAPWQQDDDRWTLTGKHGDWTLQRTAEDAVRLELRERVKDDEREENEMAAGVAE